jgi:hypothetical protein
MPRLAATLALAVAAWGCETTETIFVPPPPVPPSAPQGVFSVTGDNRVSLYWIRNTELDFRDHGVWRPGQTGRSRCSGARPPPPGGRNGGERCRPFRHLGL